MSQITALRAREIYDSRGWPTVEVEIDLESGATGRASVPAGASTGRAEACEKRDGEARLAGRGVRRAVEGLREEIFFVLSGLEASDQSLVDARLVELDGTENRARLGANALLGASLAVAHAAAAEHGVPLYRHLGGLAARTLPVPFLNVLNGGAHADNALDIQEFMVVPAGFSDFRSALEAGAEVYHALGSALRAAGLTTAVGDEGGFAPALSGAEEALELLSRAVEATGMRAGEEIFFALDCAAGELFDNGAYELRGIGRTLDTEAMLAYLEGLANAFPIVSIEDAFDESDHDGWRQLNERIGSRVQLVGDDLLVTRAERVRSASADRLANAVLVKPNQVGTLSETLETFAEAARCGFGVMLSHRSGETEDVSVADLAVASNAGQIKAGAPARGERTAKYNRLLRIEEELGDYARFGRVNVAL